MVSLVAAVLIAGCNGDPNRGTGSGGRGDGGLNLDYDAGTGGSDASGSGSDGGQQGCAAQAKGCYTVYAHSDHVLYLIDLQAKSLKTVGPFNAPKVPVGTKMLEDVITDIAVAPNDVIWAISNTNLYTASAVDGHVTLVGPVTACGDQAVALTFTPDGKLYTADFKGAFCRVDTGQYPPKVTPVGSGLSNGLALSGDLVAVADGTVFGTAYRLSDTSGGTQNNNLLVKIDPATATVTQQLGQTGYPKLFGVSYALGQVFGFTHDGTGDVITIDPKSGDGVLYNKFTDPSTGMGISFAGAGVNAMVPGTIM